MENNIFRLIQVLNNAGIKASSLDLLDSLWLATILPNNGSVVENNDELAVDSNVEKTGEKKNTNPQDEIIDNNETLNINSERSLSESLKTNIYAPNALVGGDISARDIRIVAPRALKDRLEIGRVLKLLRYAEAAKKKYVLDIDRTVEHIAEQRMAGKQDWLIYFKQKKKISFDLTVVIDKSVSMNIWQQHIKELKQILMYRGIFCKTKILYMDTSCNDVRLTIGENSKEKRLYNNNELLSKTSSQLMLVFSDCVSPAWYSGAVLGLLQSWGKHLPLALVDVLPQRMWNDSALGLGIEIPLKSKLESCINRGFQYDVGSLPCDSKGNEDRYNSKKNCLPVFGMNAMGFGAWTRFLLGKDNSWLTAYYFEEDIFSTTTNHNKADESAKQKLINFFSVASPVAQKLVAYYAATPLNFSLMRIVQTAMCPESNDGHLAEVVVSGLLKHVSVAEHDFDDFFDFQDGIRELLLDLLSENERLEVLLKVSDYISKQTSGDIDFRAVIADPTAKGKLRVNEKNKYFAKVGMNVLRRFGGDFGELIKSLDDNHIESSKIRNSTKTRRENRSSKRKRDKEESKELPSFNWIHISDLHWDGGAKEHWRGVVDSLIDDIVFNITERNQNIDAIFFTGDLVQRASVDLYDSVNEFFLYLKTGVSKSLGSDFSPVFLAVPGNHDLIRLGVEFQSVEANSILDNWDKNARNDFWRNEGSLWPVIQDAFRLYQLWWDNFDIFPKPKGYLKGLLPGEFAATFSVGENQVGVMGLNSAFLQITEKSYFERLDLHDNQFCYFNKNDERWVDRNTINILLTHHSNEWFSVNGINTYRENSNDFAYHLCGHMHKESSNHVINSNNARALLCYQARSLMAIDGFKVWNDDNTEYGFHRSHGYCVGSLKFTDVNIQSRLWPRCIDLKTPPPYKYYCDASLMVNKDGGTSTAILVNQKYNNVGKGTHENISDEIDRDKGQYFEKRIADCIAIVTIRKSNRENLWCTGFPISRTLILTVRHIFSLTQQNEIDSLEVEFQRVGDGDGFPVRSAARIVFDGGDDFDLAVLRIETPLPSDMTLLELSTQYPTDKQRWFGCGFAQMLDDNLMNPISLTGDFHHADVSEIYIALSVEMDRFNKDYWKGLSGTAVISDGMIYGVIVKHDYSSDSLLAISIPSVIRNNRDFRRFCKIELGGREGVGYEKFVIRNISETFEGNNYFPEKFKYALKLPETASAYDIAFSLLNKLRSIDSLRVICNILIEQRDIINNESQWQELVCIGEKIACWLLLGSVNYEWLFDNNLDGGKYSEKGISMTFELQDARYAEVILSRLEMKKPCFYLDLNGVVQSENNQLDAFVFDSVNHHAVGDSVLRAIYCDLMRVSPGVKLPVSELVESIKNAVLATKNDFESRRSKGYASFVYYFISQENLKLVENLPWYEELCESLKGYFKIISYRLSDESNACKVDQRELFEMLGTIIALKNKKKSNTDRTINTQNSTSIIEGVPFEQYKADLAEKESEIRQHLLSSALSEKELSALTSELAAIEIKRQNEQTSYEKHIQVLKERIAHLEKLDGQATDNLIEQEIQSLVNGDTEKADHIFTQIKKQTKDAIIPIAGADLERDETPNNIVIPEVFATIVSLVSAFMTGRDVATNTELVEFQTWLSEAGHGELKQAIEDSHTTAIYVKALLNHQLPQIIEKLNTFLDKQNTLSKSIASLVTCPDDILRKGAVLFEQDCINTKAPREVELPSMRDQSPNIHTAGNVTINYGSSMGNTVVNQDHATIDNQAIIEGIPFKQYKADLAEKENQIRRHLLNSTINQKELSDLTIELAAIETRRQYERTSYEKHIQDLEGRIARLDSLDGLVPNGLIEKARQALANGNTEEADYLFSQIEEQGKNSVIPIAEAAFQRGEIANDEVRYRMAFEHYGRAVRLVPENSDYLNMAGYVANTLGEYEHAIVFFERALALDIDTKGGTHVNVAIRCNNLGETWRAKGNYDKAIEYYELALTSDLKTFGEEHPNVAIDRNNLGLAWNAKGNYDKAIEYYELALTSDLKTFGEDHPNVATMLNNLGGGWNSKGDYDKAIVYYERALTNDLNTFGEDHPSVARDRINLGGAWVSKGDFDKAIDYYQLALASDLKTFGEDHPNVARGRNNLGTAWYSKGDYRRAIEHYEFALASDLRTFGEVHPNVAIRHNNLGNVWKARGDYSKAIKYYELALSSDLKTFGEDHPSVTRNRNNLGSTWDSLGDHDKAIEYYELALVSDLKVFGKEHPDVAIDLNNLGGAWNSKGDYDKAIQYYDQAMVILTKVLGKDHPNTKLVANNLVAVKASRK